VAKLKQLIIFTFLTMYVNAFVIAQDHDSSRQLLLNALFSDYKEVKIEKRAFISLDSKEKKRNPINYLAGGLLFMYQNVFSAQISANCVYETSCSEYTKKAIQKYGLIKGSFIGMHQLSCCTPTIHKDYCEHSISENGKIINRID
jgi:putative component of membrane protein insertase Oxa1/YidC/SpoIIIJ protein YidD